MKKSSKIKMTPQRAAIMQYLEGNRTHPSAEDIYRVVHEKYPMMSFATVYNTLGALKKMDRVLELNIDDERRRYDPNTAPHDHLICVECRRIVDIDQGGMDCVPEGQAQGFKVQQRHVEYYGLCPDCLKKRGEDAA